MISTSISYATNIAELEEALRRIAIACAAIHAPMARSASERFRWTIRSLGHLPAGLDPIERAGYADADAQRISWQIGDRHVLDLDRLETVPLRAGIDCLAFCNLQRRRNGFVACEIAKDLIGLAADAGDSGADGIGAIAEGYADDLRNAGQLFGHQEGATAHRNQGRVTGLGFHAVDILFKLPRGVGERSGDQIRRDSRDTRTIANIEQPGGHRDVGRRHLRAIEDKRVLRQTVADAEWANPRRRCVDMAAAAETDRQEVRHAEQGAYSADLDDCIGLTWKSMTQLADVA